MSTGSTAPVDAAIDIRPTFNPLGFAAGAAPICAQVWGQGPVRLRWNEVTRIPVAPGQVAVGIWMKWVTKAHMGLVHAALELADGDVVGLEWKAPQTIFGKGKLAIADLAPPVALVVPADTTPPADLGPQAVGPPHPVRRLVDLPLLAPVAAGAWHPDPTGRFALRWWDGIGWTEGVSDGTQTLTDPL